MKQAEPDFDRLLLTWLGPDGAGRRQAERVLVAALGSEQGIREVLRARLELGLPLVRRLDG